MLTFSQFKNSEHMIADVGDMVKTIEKIAASRIHVMIENNSYYTQYVSELNRALMSMNESGISSQHPWVAPRQTGKYALFVFGGNHGLVGGLNHAIVSSFQEHRHEYTYTVVVGRKVKQLLNEDHIQPDTFFDGLDDNFNTGSMSTIIDFMCKLYADESCERIDILYPKYVTIAHQESVVEQILPVSFRSDQSVDSKATLIRDCAFPIFEPSHTRVFERYIDMYIRVRFYQFMLSAKLSELSARTIEMEHASSKADLLLERVRHDFKKQRRALSTQKQFSSYQIALMK